MELGLLIIPSHGKTGEIKLLYPKRTISILHDVSLHPDDERRGSRSWTLCRLTLDYRRLVLYQNLTSPNAGDRKLAA